MVYTNSITIWSFDVLFFLVAHPFPLSLYFLPSFPVADPGFSPGGGAPTPKSAIIFHFFAENCMKMKEFGPPGVGARPWRPPPLGSANDFLIVAEMPMSLPKITVHFRWTTIIVLYYHTMNVIQLHILSRIICSCMMSYLAFYQIWLKTLITMIITRIANLINCLAFKKKNSKLQKFLVPSFLMIIKRLFIPFSLYHYIIKMWHRTSFIWT